MDNKKISLIIPCYNEEETLPIIYREIDKISKYMINESFEIIFINDGSKDNTLKILREFSKKDNRVKYISFSRNFGKEAAIFAGLKNSTGDFVAIMDSDMQDPPSLIPEMYNYVSSGEFDCAATRRIDRKGEPIIRSFFAKRFYRLINKISDADIVDGARDFRLMNRKMVEAILSMEEYNRFSKGLFGWVGFDTKWIPYENVERVAGKTKWSFWKLFLYSLEGIVAFTTTPLAIASLIGMIFCIISFIMICVIVLKTLIFGDPVAGWPSLTCLIFFVGGIQLFCTGIVGQYLAKAYLETKRRPIYIVKETNDEI